MGAETGGEAAFSARLTRITLYCPTPTYQIYIDKHVICLSRLQLLRTPLMEPHACLALTEDATVEETSSPEKGLR